MGGPIGPYKGPMGPYKGPMGQKKVFWGCWTFLGVFGGLKNDEICIFLILVKSILQMLTSNSLVRS